MKSVVKKLLFAAILMSFASFLCADFWTITDWSYATSFDSIVNLNGTRQPGNLILDAPDIRNWEYLVSLPNAQEVYDLLSTDSFLFAATGDDSGDVFYSSDCGGHWCNTASIQGLTGVNVLFSPNDSTIFAGCTNNGSVGKVATSSIPVDYWSISSSLGWSVVSFAFSNSFLLCSISDWDPKIYISYNSTEWQLWYTLDGYSCFIDFINLGPDTIITISSPQDGIVVRSIDGGSSWNPIDTLNMNITCMEFDAFGNLFAGAQNGKIMISTDDGFNWAETTPIPNILTISSNNMVYNNSKLFVGAGINGNKGKIFFTEDNGINWDSTPVISNGKFVSSVEFCKNGFGFCGTNIDGSVYRAGYFVRGCLISKPFYTGTTNGSTKYGIVHWVEGLTGKILNVRVRTAQDSLMSTAMPWSAGVPACTNGDSIVNSPAVNNGDPYIQYRVEFETDDPGITPVLNELSIEYSIDTLGPKPVSAVAYDGTIQQNGIDDDDYVIISFDEPTNAYHIPKDSIDYYLKLNQGSWGVVDTAYWSNVGNASDLTVELNATSTIPIGVRISPDTVIEDVWNNNAYSSVTLTGTFDDTIAPTIISACASDNIDSIQGIDGDDFVRVIFDQATDTPLINSSNINNVFKLSSGHTWAIIDSTEWAVSGKTLTVFLDTIGTPTIEVGDTIFPDSATIKDLSGNPCASAKIITGTFGDYGPVIDSAVAYEAIPYIPGVDSGDYVYLYFNEETNAPAVNSGNINSILKLGNGHSWNTIIDGPPTGWNGTHTIFRVFLKDNAPTISVGDTIYPDSITILDTLDQSCIHPIVLKGTFSPGVEESKNSKITLPARLNLSVHPNPSLGRVTIYYDIPVRNSALEKSSVKLEMFDISGRKRKRLVNQDLMPGRYQFRCDYGSIKRGVYFVKITSLQKSITRKLIHF